MREAVTVLIPTYDNVDQLNDCVSSMIRTIGYYPLKIIVINNGEADLSHLVSKDIEVLNPGRNLGWEGGLKEGLKHTSTKYVLFANDDIYLPQSAQTWMRDMVRLMEVYPEIGAQGPSTNVAMGTQNIWSPPFMDSFVTTFLIGFCMLLRRSALDEVGGVDDTLPGGDDLDISIRMRKAGHILVVNRHVFVYHHGFQTGNRVHGDHMRPGGWNSPQMTENTNTALIRKHGFLNWWQTLTPIETPTKEKVNAFNADTEGDAVRSFLIPGSTVELGVGAKKTVPDAIGIDRIPKDHPIPYIAGVSQADIVADVQEPLPLTENETDNVIARHILEHCVDSVQTLKQWAQPLKDGGRLIISVPDERITDTIPVNPEHVHAFTPESLQRLGEAVGLEHVGTKTGYNGISFTICFKK